MKSTIVAGALLALFHSQAPAPSALRIVVLEGEDAVNIVQQKTAVRPLVEVRDRNNLPVAGATVTFTIGGGQPAAFAGGLQTLTVTTNAAGQAAASGLSALGSGACGIQVQAESQGQLATASISQTNFATTAAAAQAGGASGVVGSAVGAAGGAAGGGGMSATTIGIIGAAVGGGALAATQLAGSSDGNGDEGGVAPPGGGSSSGGGNSNTVTFAGPLSGQLVFTQTSGTSTCVSTRAIVGTLRIQLRDGNTTGTADTDGSQTEVSFTQSPTCSPVSTVPFNNGGSVTGGPANLTFSTQTSFTGPVPSGNGSVTATNTLAFSGRFEGGAITGTLTYTLATRGNNGTTEIAGNGSTTMAVTLR